MYLYSHFYTYTLHMENEEDKITHVGKGNNQHTSFLIEIFREVRASQQSYKIQTTR